MKKIGLKLIPLVLFFLLSLFLWRGLSLNPKDLPSVVLGKSLPPFQLSQLQNPHTLVCSEQLHDQVVLFNVWASWCSSCAQEQAFLMQLAQKGIPMYGLNYKDTSTDALHWLEQWGNPYQLVLQDPQGKVAIDLGVYGVPETFVLDKKGVIQYRHAGIMTAEIWLKDILPLMNRLQAAG